MDQSSLISVVLVLGMGWEQTNCCSLATCMLKRIFIRVCSLSLSGARCRRGKRWVVNSENARKSSENTHVLVPQLTQLFLTLYCSNINRITKATAGHDAAISTLHNCRAIPRLETCRSPLLPLTRTPRTPTCPCHPTSENTACAYDHYC